MTAIYGFASVGGAEQPAIGQRTWETEPAGWFRFAGPAGRYTLAFSTPAHYMRPLVVSNLDLHDGDDLDRTLQPRFDYAMFADTSGMMNPRRPISSRSRRRERASRTSGSNWRPTVSTARVPAVRTCGSPSTAVRTARRTMAASWPGRHRAGRGLRRCQRLLVLSRLEFRRSPDYAR